WQPLEDLGGTVQFENAGMNATVTDGEIAGAHVVKSNVTIADFFDPQLDVAAEVAGTLSDFIAFLRASPIGGEIRNTFDHFKTSGAASTKLTIRLPIMHPERFTLAGKLAINNAEFRYGDAPYALKQLRGSLSYDGDGPTGGKLQGSLLDVPVTLSFSREAAADVKGGKRLRVALDGRFPLAVLSKAVGDDLSRYASGSLPLHAELAVPLAVKVLPLAVTLFSSLDGLAIKLPAPAGKSAAEKRPFAARLDIDTGTLDALARYADVVSACAGITDGDAQSGVRAAEVILGGSTCEIPAAGYFLRGGWRKLDVGAWLNELPPKQRGAAKPSPWTLETLGLNLRFDEVRVFGETLQNQTIKGALGPTQMEILLSGPDLAGRVLIPRKPDNDHPIVAELTRGRFALPKASALVKSSASAAKASASASATVAANAGTVHTAVVQTTQTPTAATAALAETKQRHGLSPRDIPPFFLHVEHLELGDAKLDDVSIVARRVPNGLLVKPIHVGGGTLALEGQLSWLNPPTSRSQGALQFVAKINGLGKLLAGFGLGQVFTGHGALSAGLAWREPPGGGKFADGLLGKVSTDLRDGSISEVSPGAGRLLSLLNLANIPRYLVFNFHDLFGKGFPYSRIHGDYDINQGIAKTEGLDIESSIADIKLTGSVNLVQGTLDQTAAVEPNYFGSLPIIGAIVGGLGVGAAIYAITKIFGSSLADASKMEYSISGPIDNPVVKKMGTAPPATTSQKPVSAPAATTTAGGA
ncbi:MAG: YhdP family protein, partial [Gammaproteobacteria bacterium]